VGFPISKSIEKVLAAINSSTKKGRGLILAFLQKKIIKGVKVKIITSLEVKTVRIEVVIYRIIKTDNCVWLAFCKALLARYLNNPASSRTIDRQLIEINKQSIFKGFIWLEAVSSLISELKSTNLRLKIKTAPNKGGK